MECMFEVDPREIIDDGEGVVGQDPFEGGFGKTGCVVAPAIQRSHDEIHVTSGSEAEMGARVGALVVAYLHMAGQYVDRFNDVALCKAMNAKLLAGVRL
jgi:hypothetical protein